MTTKINVIVQEAIQTARECDQTGMLVGELATLYQERDELLKVLKVLREQAAAAMRVGQRYQSACCELEARIDSMAERKMDLEQTERAFSRARCAAVRAQAAWDGWNSTSDELSSTTFAKELFDSFRFLGVRLSAENLLDILVKHPAMDDAEPTDVEAAKAVPTVGDAPAAQAPLPLHSPFMAPGEMS